MARFAKLALLLVSGFGFTISSPSESHAGVIPWVYDAIFGPVGSMQARRVGYPMTTAYAPYSAGYAPYYGGYSAAYMPVTVAQYSAPSGGCSTCSQTSYYAPAAIIEPSFGSMECSTCGSGGCASGNCASGNCASGNCSSGTCTNCTVNSAPGSNTSGYGPAPTPIPDPNFSSKEEIRRLERKIEELDHREKQTERFLRRQHNDFVPETYRPGNSIEEDVPARQQRETFESSNPSTFERPSSPAPSRYPTETDERTEKPILPPKSDESSDKKEEGTTQFRETEPQASRYDSRITTRAVVPKERMQIVTKQTRTSVAKSGKNPVKTSGTTQPTSLVRN